MVRLPPPITLLRGRTEPVEDGRAAADDVLLEAEVWDLPPEEGLPLAEGLEPDGLGLEEGLEPVDGVLAFGAAGFSADGGTFACATGAPPLDRL